MQQLIVLAAFFVVWLPMCTAADERDPDHFYITWEGWEPDKGASAWLIKRFIDTQAQFKQVAKGEAIEQGTAFDVPESPYRRTHHFSTFEMLQRAFRVEDENVKRLAVVIHDMEINTWGRKLAKETPYVEQLVMELRRLFGDKAISLDCGIAAFDGVYVRFKNNDWQTPLEVPGLCHEAVKD